MELFIAIKTFRPKSYVHTIERWAHGVVIMLCALPILSCFSFDVHIHSHIGLWNKNKTFDLIEFGCIKFDQWIRNGNRICTSHANKEKKRNTFYPIQSEFTFKPFRWFTFGIFITILMNSLWMESLIASSNKIVICLNKINGTTLFGQIEFYNRTIELNCFPVGFAPIRIEWQRDVHNK